MESTDEAFVARTRDGDTDAFRVLVERHSRPLFRLAFRMTGNQQDAEDVVQESLLRAYRQLAKFDGRASFGTWLYRIAANCSLDLVRSRKRRAEVPAALEEPGRGETEERSILPASGDPTPERAALSGEMRLLVAAAMDEMSDAERTAFVLRHFEGVRIEEVCRVLGCRPGAAKHTIFRAVQKMRRALEPAMSPAK